MSACTQECEKEHTRKREMVCKKENVWKGARKRWHEKDGMRKKASHEGMGKSKCMVAGKATR